METKKRISRQDYFLGIAVLVSQRSTCPRASVGAVLVDAETNHIAATGFNGGLPKTRHCYQSGCLIEIKNGREHCRRTIHAELNAVLQLERNYKRLSLYVTHKPCADCVKALLTVGVREIYYIEDYEDLIRDELVDEWETTTIGNILRMKCCKGIPSTETTP